jgi:YD repeat-containing protein
VSEYLDGFGRTYRTASKGPDAGQEILVDQTFTARGALASKTRPYYSTEAPPTPTPTRYDHDALDRVTRVLLPDGEQATTVYGAWKQTATDPLGRATTVTFDAFGRKRTVEQDDGQGRTLVTQHGYDLRGALTSFHDPAGNAWSWQYDSLGRMLARSDPDAGTWTFAYDILGRKTTQTDAKGQVSEQWSDAAGRVTQKRTTDANAHVETVTFSYGEPRAGYFNVGRLTTMTDAHGGARYDHDALGRQVRVTRTLDGVDYALERRYDAAGRLLGLTFPDGDAFGSPSSPMLYDAAGRLVAVPGVLASATYDAAGRRLAAVFANGAATEWDYHERGWVTGITTTVGTTTIQALDYTMDAAGQTTQVTSPNPAESWTYAYDALGRLVSATSPSPGLDQSFQYDAAGNMTYNSRVGALTYPLPGAPRPHAPSAVNGDPMTYDANGSRSTSRPARSSSTRLSAR